MSHLLGDGKAIDSKYINAEDLWRFHQVDTANEPMRKFMLGLRHGNSVIKAARFNFAIMYFNNTDEHKIVRFVVYKGQNPNAGIFKLRADVVWIDKGSKAAYQHLSAYLQETNMVTTGNPRTREYTHWPLELKREAFNRGTYVTHNYNETDHGKSKSPVLWGMQYYPFEPKKKRGYYL